MKRYIEIEVEGVKAKAELYNNDMADMIWNNLPMTGDARIWGDEIYFPISVEEGEGEKKDVVEIGELGFWDQGNAFCIFFGPTPMSKGSKPRPASPVTVFGMVESNIEVFKQVVSGAEVNVSKTSE